MWSGLSAEKLRLVVQGETRPEETEHKEGDTN